MHQITLFRYKKFKNFLARGHSPSPDSTPSGEVDTPSLQVSRSSPLRSSKSNRLSNDQKSTNNVITHWWTRVLKAQCFIINSELPTEADSAPGVHDTRRRSIFSRQSRTNDRRKTAGSLWRTTAFSSAIHKR